MADATPNSVTRDDLRDALSTRGRKRPTSLLSSEPSPAPAWEWDAGMPAGERLELDELRQVVAEQREHLETLTAAQESAAEREHELREALAELAGAGMLARRALVAELRASGLV
jgi:DNA-binding transcriptional MocR family regulator